VLHYRDDKVIPFAGGEQLAATLPDVRFLPLDGGFHLPDARDLDLIVRAMTDFAGTPSRTSRPWTTARAIDGSRCLRGRRGKWPGIKRTPDPNGGTGDG
jgi:hypothetical protein